MEQKTRVFVVDDDPMARVLLPEFLKRESFEVDLINDANWATGSPPRHEDWKKQENFRVCAEVETTPQKVSPSRATFSSCRGFSFAGNETPVKFALAWSPTFFSLP